MTSGNGKPWLEFIGGDSEKFNEYIYTNDPCFGKYFAKSAAECKACITPVIVDGQLKLLRDVCQAVCAQAPIGVIVRLSAQQVLQRLQAGKNVAAIWLEMVGTADAQTVGAEVRQILYDRLWWLKNQGHLVPTLPKTSELLECTRSPKK